jgi:uncharacterized protein YkwD
VRDFFDASCTLARTFHSSGAMVRRRVEGRARPGGWHRVGVPALLLLLPAACGDDPVSPAAGEPTDPQVASFATLVNDHRASVGCGPLTWVPAVADVARAHSVDMYTRGFFDHVNPDGDSPFDRMHDAGLSFSRAAENIAWGYPSPEAVLQGWLDSPGHRTNIEDCSLTEHGVGLHETYWTHLFRTP